MAETSSSEVTEIRLVRPTSQGFIDVRVAPLAAQEYARFCVELSLVGDSGNVLWQKADICSDAYGDGESLGFVAVCDERNNPQSLHATLIGAFHSADIAYPASLPCGDGQRCEIAVDCVMNADISVEIEP